MTNTLERPRVSSQNSSLNFANALSLYESLPTRRNYSTAVGANHSVRFVPRITDRPWPVFVGHDSRTLSSSYFPSPPHYRPNNTVDHSPGKSSFRLSRHRPNWSANVSATRGPRRPPTGGQLAIYTSEGRNKHGQTRSRAGVVRITDFS